MSVLMVVQLAYWSPSAIFPLVSYEFAHSDCDPEPAQNLDEGNRAGAAFSRKGSLWTFFAAQDVPKLNRFCHRR